MLSIANAHQPVLPSASHYAFSGAVGRPSGTTPGSQPQVDASAGLAQEMSTAGGSSVVLEISDEPCRDTTIFQFLQCLCCVRTAGAGSASPVQPPAALLRNEPGIVNAGFAGGSGEVCSSSGTGALPMSENSAAGKPQSPPAQPNIGLPQVEVDVRIDTINSCKFLRVVRKMVMDSASVEIKIDLPLKDSPHFAGQAGSVGKPPSLKVPEDMMHHAGMDIARGCGDSEVQKFRFDKGGVCSELNKLADSENPIIRKAMVAIETLAIEKRVVIRENLVDSKDQATGIVSHLQFDSTDTHTEENFSRQVLQSGGFPDRIESVVLDQPKV